MTEPGTAVAAGRLLPAACPPGPEAVSRPSLGDGPGGSWGGRWEKVSPPHTPTLLGFSCLATGDREQGTGRGGCWTRNTDWAGGRVGAMRELMVQRRNEAPPPGVRTQDTWASWVAGWGTKERGGDTYLINWPRSSHRVSQPGHLHSPCPYRGWEPGVSSWEELQGRGRRGSGTLNTPAAWVLRSPSFPTDEVSVPNTGSPEAEHSFVCPGRSSQLWQPSGSRPVPRQVCSASSRPEPHTCLSEV